nr:phage major capsid protein [uncultured Comamonas sp.]
MSLVTQLRSERAQLNNQLQALAQKDASGAALSADELTQFTSLETQITELSAKITRAESAERINAQAAVPVNESARGIASPPATAHITVTDNEPPGAKMAQMARLLAAARGNQLQAAQMAQDGGYGQDIVQALSTTTPGAGGVLIPENMATSVIPSLRPKSVVRAMGAVSMPLNNGNMTMSRIKGNTMVGYIGAEQGIPVTDMSFEPMKLQAKTMAALVPIANDLLAFQGVNPRVDSIVATDMVTSLGLGEDLHYIRSAGSAILPKGLRFWAIPYNVVIAPVDPTLQQIDLFLGGLMLRLEAANADMANCGWLAHPRTIRWLQSLRDGNGNKAYPEIDQGQLKGYRFALSTQIPVNLGAGGDESEIYFVDFADCYIGETGQYAMDYSTEASYKDANGDMVSAFQHNQTLIRILAKNDFAPRHVESIAVGVAVKWGAGM